MSWVSGASRWRPLAPRGTAGLPERMEQKEGVGKWWAWSPDPLCSREEEEEEGGQAPDGMGGKEGGRGGVFQPGLNASGSLHRPLVSWPPPAP